MPDRIDYLTLPSATRSLDRGAGAGAQQSWMINFARTVQFLLRLQLVSKMKIANKDRAAMRGIKAGWYAMETGRKSLTGAVFEPPEIERTDPAQEVPAVEFNRAIIPDPR